MNAIIEHADFESSASFTVFTPRSRAAFLENLQLFGNVRLACRAARVSAQTAYRARRACRSLAQLWDAALLAARAHAEAVLAERALNGVEEAVYYHGEEVARRRRYDSRLLLAHLARLDRLEEREEVAATLPHLDHAIEALRRGEEPGHIVALDPVPSVPSVRSDPAPVQQEREAEGEAEWAAYCERVRVMEEARPAGVPTAAQLNADPRLDLQMVQLEAFEEGLGEWWTIASEEELDERLEAAGRA